MCTHKSLHHFHLCPFQVWPEKKKAAIKVNGDSFREKNSYIFVSCFNSYLLLLLKNSICFPTSTKMKVAFVKWLQFICSSGPGCSKHC